MKKSRFLLELNEVPNEGGLFSLEFVRHFLILRVLKIIFLKMTLLTQFSQNFIQIYGQSALFGRFVRKFLAIMMRFYGQSTCFHRYGRKRQ
nr:hypothetical protein [Ligilactobacillus ruminis]